MMKILRLHTMLRTSFYPEPNKGDNNKLFQKVELN